MANEKYEGKTGVQALEGVTYSRSVTANTETKVVDVVHVTRCKDGDAYVTTRFDFTGVDESDVLECAAKNLVIACRLTEFRTRTVDEVCKLDGMTLKPLDYIKRERSKTPETPQALISKLRKKFGLSDKEIAALVKETV